jgi:hypothetical protein
MQKRLRWIEKANLVHNNRYNYSLVDYVNTQTKVKIICPTHGEFEQRPHDHVIKKCGCRECWKINKSLERTFSIEQFLINAKQSHGDKYDYSKVEYSSQLEPVCIICPDHGEFWQRPVHHAWFACGCKKCSSSKGENRIRAFLDNNNIDYILQEQKVCSCINPKTNKVLPFDFYLPNYKMCIEYDGDQHYKPFSFNSNRLKETMIENLEYQKYKDQIKTEYCKDNDIRLLRIPYWKQRNIEKILEKELLCV